MIGASRIFGFDLPISTSSSGTLPTTSVDPSTSSVSATPSTSTITPATSSSSSSSSSVASREIKAGTYLLNETVTFPAANTTTNVFVSKGYTLTANNTYVSEAEEITSWSFSEGSGTFSPGSKVNNFNLWTTMLYDFSSGSLVTYTANDTTLMRTIIVESDQTAVNSVFVAWFMANTTIKQENQDEDPQANFLEWKFNDSLSLPSETTIYNLDFISNNYTFNKIELNRKGFVSYYFADDSGDTTVPAYEGNFGGQYAPYQIIKVDSSSTDYATFVNWAKSNGGILLETGTYKWIDVINPFEKNLAASFSFQSNNTNYTYLDLDEENQIMQYFANGGPTTGGEPIITYESGTWDNIAFKNITTTESQYINYDFYVYAIEGNQLVKQETLPTTSETWLLNETIEVDSKGYDESYTTSFTSNNEIYTLLKIQGSSVPTGEAFEASIYYGDTHVRSGGAWVSEAYRTLIFDEAPTGNLLVWLQANATKQ